MAASTCAILSLVLVAACRGAACAPARSPKAQPELLLGVQQNCTPRQVHITVGTSPAEMHVSWVTEGATCPSEVSWWPALQGGDGKDGVVGDPLHSAIGYSFLLSERDMCSEPAASNQFQLYVHRATMSGLTPGGRYRYRIAGGGTARAFSAQPAVAPAQAFSFVAYGDMGESSHPSSKSPGAAPTMARLVDRELTAGLDLVLHVGDVAYADGQPEVWDRFMESIEPLAARVPYTVQVGNHDYSSDYSSSDGGSLIDPSGGRHVPYRPAWGNFGRDSGGECGVMLARRFHMPSRSRDHNPPFYYSFEHGSALFVAVCTELDLEPGSRQRAWLEAELARTDRCRTPWLVLLVHRPMYVAYPHKSNRVVGEHLRASLEPLLRRHLVDLVISGHVHSYYRTCAVYGGECVGSGGDSYGDDGHGTVHVVAGSAGRKLSRLECGQEKWVAAAEETWGYTRFNVQDPVRMSVEFVESETGLVLDTFDVDASAERLRLRDACPGDWPSARGHAASGTAVKTATATAAAR